MNPAILKSLTLSVIALVVTSALLLAASLQPRSQAPGLRLAQNSQASTAKHRAGMQLMAFPAERAASAAVISRVAELR